MSEGSLGKLYQNGENIIRQGDVGNCMYVVQQGEVEVLLRKGESDVCVAVLSAGDFFGEMALFDHEVRSATIRARGEVRVLTLEKKSFLRRIHEDPSLAFRMLEKMSGRIRELNASLNAALGRRNVLRPETTSAHLSTSSHE
ncbi:MAG: cyclic nucleotide-binding domain-containing protein [Terriglobia bacterium]